MINSITTTNFETHLDTIIELHPGVNSFVGESDEGKSSIVRQIKWNSKNRPQGDSYRNDQLDPKDKEDRLKLTSVTIDYEGAGKIQRARDGLAGGVNHYVINDGEPLRALRSDVPDEVQDITRMKDVNIQGQHPTEQYFLLADKPGQVAKEFNKVAGLTVMDKATADINSQVRTCNTEIKLAKAEIDTRQTEIKETEWVDAAEKFATKLMNFKKGLVQKSIELETISNAITSIENIDTKLKKYDGVKAAKITLSFLEKEKRSIDTKLYHIKSISETVLAIKSIDLKLSVTTDIEKAIKTLKTLHFEKDKIDSSKTKLVEISTLLTRFKKCENYLIEAERDLQETQKEYDIIRAEQECPTCGRSGI